MRKKSYIAEVGFLLIAFFLSSGASSSAENSIQLCSSPDLIERLEFKPKIDGDLGEWRERNYKALGSNSFYEEYYSGIYKIGWRPEGLYFCFDIFDRSLVNPHSSSSRECLSGDSIEIYGTAMVSKAPESEKILNIDFIEHSFPDSRIVRVDNSDSRIEFVGKGWVTERNLSVCKGARFVGTPNEPMIRYEFEGDNVRVVGEFQRLSGIIDVVLDGSVVRTIDCYSPFDKKGAIFFETNDLDPGKHELLIRTSKDMLQGIFHARVNVAGLVEGRTDSISVYGMSKNESKPRSIQLAAIEKVGGWVVEGMIPPEAFEMKSFSYRDTIRFGYKLRDNVQGRSLGLVRHGSGTSVDWLSYNQGRLPLCVLTDRLAYFPGDLEIYEDSLSDSSWISIRYAVNFLEVDNPYIVINIDGLDIVDRRCELVESVGGKYYYYYDHIRVPNGYDCDQPLSVSVTLYDKIEKSWKRTKTLELEIAKAKQEIRQTFAPFYGKSNDKNFLSFLAMVEQACIESCEFEVRRESEKFKHFYQLHHYNNNQLTENLISNTITYIEELFSSGIALDGFENHPLQAWKSDIDGSWRQMRIIFPDNFKRDRRYPLTLFYHGLQQKKHSLDKALNEYLKLREFVVWERNSFKNDLAIKLFGRGNSFKKRGEEELRKTLYWLAENLDIDFLNTTFYGGSTGASQAWLSAMRHPDLSSRLYLRSMFNDFTSGWRIYGGLSPWEEALRDARDDYKALIWNTRKHPLMLVVGGADPGPLAFMKQIEKELVSIGQQVEMIIVPGGGHMGLPAFPWSGGSIDSSKDSSFTYRSGDLRYNEAYGFRLDDPIDQLKAMGISVSQDNSQLTVVTENLRGLSILGEKMENIRNVLIDGTILQESDSDSDNNGWMSFERGSTDRWIKSNSEIENRLVKTRNRPGPMDDFANGNFVIVYGTLDPLLIPIYKNRAFMIKEALSGLEVGQINGARFIVKADSELEPVDVENSSLWFVGKPKLSKSMDKIVSLIDNLAGLSVFREELDGSGDALLQVLYPSPLYDDGYIFLELGNSPNSYLFTPMRFDKFDYVVSKARNGREITSIRGLFNRSWELDLETLTKR